MFWGQKFGKGSRCMGISKDVGPKKLTQNQFSPGYNNVDMPEAQRGAGRSPLERGFAVELHRERAQLAAEVRAVAVEADARGAGACVRAQQLGAMAEALLRSQKDRKLGPIKMRLVQCTLGAPHDPGEGAPPGRPCRDDDREIRSRQHGAGRRRKQRRPPA